MYWHKVLPHIYLLGPNCSLAYAELYLGLSMLVKEFEFKVITGDEEMKLIDVFATFFNTRKVELELRRRVSRS